MQSFHDVRFPTDISLGVIGGPSRSVDIVELANGREIRNARFAHSRRSYKLGSGVKSAEELYKILEFYEARCGSLYGFRLKDWSDYSSAKIGHPVDYHDQFVGVGNNIETKFQLKKFYQSGDVYEPRKITKPIISTLRIGVENRELAIGEDVKVDAMSGVLQFMVPPEKGAIIRAGFEFDVPVRFDTEELTVNLAHFEAGEIANIQLKEILE